MEVTKLDVKPSEKIENIKFYKNPEKVFHKSFVRLRKLEVYPDDDSNPYGLADLQLHGLGLKTKILSKRRVNEELLNYIFHPTLPFSLDEKQRSNKKETTESNVISEKNKAYNVEINTIKSI
ncbi:hypothetical protein A3O11_03650 [Ligilactobacillus aviarius]|uniref:hypothetical protein n=1 Tax=Ligilactobacillus aviarius TaxID=1606 RepID=UPI0007D93FBB|nr:hypothetical protein [Ligilactobacillus aviarius]OAQ02342.1 hypothetical protein A3O10_02000 [Ligilactobacillus aviarius]OAQ05095.1 hypothetical protein A3O11_03650 [Ligilactobacillus aviarius]OAS79125.1 hypothetical protein A3O18_05985 [Ligilactobacillus aviarius]PEG71502.1 hypothetical protein A3P04_00265 [Ligilactobacillus aviarius]PEG73876.1 hypothetical protein A3O82_04430 [Ligilactobacillus aviarius]